MMLVSVMVSHCMLRSVVMTGSVSRPQCSRYVDVLLTTELHKILGTFPLATCLVSIALSQSCAVGKMIKMGGA